MNSEEKREWACAALRSRQQELGRTPVKADFDRATLCRIKACLGPFPRALEEAGLKEVPERLKP